MKIQAEKNGWKHLSWQAMPLAAGNIVLMLISALILIFHMVSVDMSYLLSWGSILVQDIVLPLRKKPFTPNEQLRLIRYIIAALAGFSVFFSFFFGQVDYVLMFFAITGAIWLGGSGPCITGGLYWKRGSTAGAWAANRSHHNSWLVQVEMRPKTTR